MDSWIQSALNFPEISEISDFFKTRSLALPGYPDKMLIFHHREGISKLNSYYEIHNRFCLLITLKGAFRMLLEGWSHWISAGNAILLFPYQNHSFTAEESGTFTFGITFEAHPATSFAPLRDHPFILSNADQEQFSTLFHLWQENQPENIWFCSAILYKILTSAVAEGNYVNRNMPKVLQSLLKAFRSQDLINCSAKEISVRFDLSQSRLSAMCRQVIGIPLGAYLRHLKLDYAIYLLSATNLSVSEISERVGFDSAAAFCRLFKREYAMTPGECRQFLTSGNVQLLYRHPDPPQNI